MIELNDNEVRVLAAIYEKERTTPEQYPLTLNSLTLACNQKSNRYPLVNFNKETVVKAIESLKDKKLVWESFIPGKRVPKYQHQFSEISNSNEQEEAILVILMLRGPQTVGEIKTRSNRLYNFSTTQEVSELLDKMLTTERSLIKQLPRQSGQKECRFAHLLAGKPQLEINSALPKQELATLAVQDEQKRILNLENEFTNLKDELKDLKNEFNSFRKEFD